MSKFKVGDRVRGVGTCDFRNIDGLYGTVKREGLFAMVHFDKPMGGWGDTVYNIPLGHGWNVKEENLSLVGNSHKILITTDGTTTLARLYEGKKVVRTAQAKCAPGDTFDFSVGAKLAYDRLMGRVAEVPPKAEKPAQEPIKLCCVKDYEAGKWLTKGKTYEATRGLMDGRWSFTYDSGWTDDMFNPAKEHFSGEPPIVGTKLFPLVKRPAKVGEWVLATNANDDTNNTYKNGDILKIVKPWSGDMAHYETKPGKWLSVSEYLVLDGYKG